MTKCHKCGKKTEREGELYCKRCASPLVEAGIKHAAQIAFNRQFQPFGPGSVDKSKRKTLDQLIERERKRIMTAQEKEMAKKK